MKEQSRWLLFATWVLTMLFLPGLAAGTTYYVDDGGSNSNSGLSLAEAWKTITYAAGQVSGGTAVAPHSIIVAAGTYDLAANGEVFPITFSGDYISLEGNGAASVTIDTPGAALAIDGKGIRVSGFTFENASSAIAFSEGGFTVTDNIFENTVNEGVVFMRIENNLSSSVSYGAMVVSNNVFRTSVVGVQALLEQTFDSSTENLTAAIGSLTISGNIFELSSGSGVSIPSFVIAELLNGTATVGDITVTGNSFTGGESGFVFSYATYSYLEDTRLTVGSTLISNNSFTNQHSSAIIWGDMIVDTVSGGSAVVHGGLTVQDNTITSDPISNPGCDGIVIPNSHMIHFIGDESTVTTAGIRVIHNSVAVASIPLYFMQGPVIMIGEQYWEDTVVITIGSTTISDNTLTSDANSGVIIQNHATGDGIFGLSKVVREPMTFINNTVVSERTACMIEDTSSGRHLFEDSSLLVKSMTIRNNPLTSRSGEALVIMQDHTASALEDNASVTIQSVNISGNTLTSPTTGIMLFHLGAGTRMQDKSSYTKGAVTIDNNTFNPDKIASMTEGIVFMNDTIALDNTGPTVTSIGDISITNNKLYTIADSAVALRFSSLGSGFRGTGRLTLGDIEISDNTMDKIHRGVTVELIGLETGSGATVSIGELNINRNILTDISGSGVFSNYLSHNQAPDTANLTIGAISIADNSISGTSATDNGIFLNVDNLTDGITFGVPTLSGNNVTGFINGIFLSKDVKAAELSCNTLESNMIAGLFLDSNETFTLSNNGFVGNGKGLQISGAKTATVTAEKNWWGDAAGPAACASCNKIDVGGGSVDYTPWLTHIAHMQCSRFPWPMFIPAVIGGRL